MPEFPNYIYIWIWPFRLLQCLYKSNQKKLENCFSCADNPSSVSSCLWTAAPTCGKGKPGTKKCCTAGLQPKLDTPVDGVCSCGASWGEANACKSGDACYDAC